MSFTESPSERNNELESITGKSVFFKGTGIYLRENNIKSPIIKKLKSVDTLGLNVNDRIKLIPIPIPPINPIVVLQNITEFNNLSIGFLNGNLEISSPLVNVSSFNSAFNTGGLQNVVILISSSFDSSSFNTSFVSGSIQNTVTIITSSFDSSAFNTSFVSGSNTIVIFPTDNLDSSSFNVSFVSGSIQNIVTMFTSSFDSSTFTIGFSGGNLI